MGLDSLITQISESIEELTRSIETRQPIPSLGLRRSARVPVVAALLMNLPRLVVYITDRADHALTFAEELELWAPKLNRLVYPEPTPLFYENAAWGDATRRDRLLTLTTLATCHIPGATPPPTPFLIIAPTRALMTRTVPRRDFLNATRTLRLGQSIQLDDLAHNWVSLGYEPVNTVIAPGQFARRGGILDLWPPAEAIPVRLELFGDEIETLRHFDPTTQRTYKLTSGVDTETTEQTFRNEPQRVLVTPAKEFLSSQLSDTEYFTEFDIPRLHPTPAGLLDYLPRSAWVIIDDALTFEETVGEIEEQAVKMRQDAIQDGTLPADFPIPYLTWPEIQDTLTRYPLIELGSSIADTEAPSEDQNISTPHHLAEQFSAGPRFAGRLKPVMDHLIERYRSGETLVIVSRQSARLNELWREESVPTVPTASEPIFIEGSLTEGWIFTPTTGHPLNLLTDGEIFGWQRPKPRQRRSERYRIAPEAPEAGYADLQMGDWIVHMDHGIGRFIGLVRRAVEGIEREYLCLEYADEAQLFVPVHQVDRLSRYVGSDNRSPTPSRLGSTEWRSVKSHVKEAVREIAEDLLALYAQRSVIEGYAFGADSPWQQELEASFPYIETEDQMRVLAEVKRDMQNNRPMDRLICGDVGYGKTEVALRAAFKAVNDSRQVAILVPTTVLAQQHYNTFQQRLAAYPVSVEMLSRFRTPHQQRDILERLSKGQIDIVIGTHRLLSTDVVFKDLGLVIIDEEQRFGVTHKETLKKMRTEVDVLTLTATPIPRTLYMALSGVRDISTINTPPEERLPIVTHVGPYSPKLVRQAILRELERGGQIFFVHNRVQTIEAMRKHLENLAPEARVTIAHGQMPETELAERMEMFNNGAVDVLLSTSIIESGLDIPNANTLIVDRADTFGLAQLYQLRGRVGRGAQRAYAYFFRHNKKLPSLEGRQRLETIAENTQLGSGFSIAMRDLEIRGTGDILGTRQHGHIAAVGFHLYTRLLSEAVKRLRSEKGLTSIDLGSRLDLPFRTVQLSSVSVELPLPVSIPTEYVADKTIRLGLYRRIADLRASDEIDALNEELQDRFGPLPTPTHNLFYQLKVRLLAEQAGLATISAEGGQLVMRYPDNILPEVLPDLGPAVRIGKTALWMSYKALPDWQTLLVGILNSLKTNHKEETKPDN